MSLVLSKSYFAVEEAIKGDKSILKEGIFKSIGRVDQLENIVVEVAFAEGAHVIIARKQVTDGVAVDLHLPSDEFWAYQVVVPI